MMNKRALTIGINKYEHLTQLNNAENDAIDTASFLTKVGFEVTTILNPSHRDLIKSVAEFKLTISSDTISIIFFAGHGLQWNENNYLVPTDANVTREEEIPYFCLHASDCLIDKKGVEEYTHLLILDACRNNPFKLGRRSVDTGLAKMPAPLGTMIAFSTSPNHTSLENAENRNGVYTQELLNCLKVPNTSLERIFKNTRTKVIKLTQGRQVPWEESSLHGEDFFFIKEPSAVLFTIRKELSNPYYVLVEDKLDFFPINEETFNSLNNPEKIKINYFEAIDFLKKQWLAYQNTIHPTTAFYFLCNLQNIIQKTYAYVLLTNRINFERLYDLLIQNGTGVAEQTIGNYHTLLMTCEAYKGIFLHNDKFGNLNTIKREFKNGLWIGILIEGDVLQDQNKFFMDMEFLKKNYIHLDEFFKSKILLEIIQPFFFQRSSKLE